MSKARLTNLRLAKFKSFGLYPQEIALAPLTVLVGRNSSGKSSVIQSLLLLKQTLAHPRREAPLHLEGAVNAFSLRELTHGWPSEDDEIVAGPEIHIAWESTVEPGKLRNQRRSRGFAALYGTGKRPLDLAKLSHEAGIRWLGSAPASVRMRTSMSLYSAQRDSRIELDRIELRSSLLDGDREITNPSMAIVQHLSGDYSLRWNGVDIDDAFVEHLQLDLDHFIPYLHIPPTAPPKVRAYANGFRVLYEQPLDDLRELLLRFRYLGPARVNPPSIYRPASSPPEDVGLSGEYAAQLLHARRSEAIHWMPLVQLPEEGGPLVLPETVEANTLTHAVNKVARQLGIGASFHLEDVQNVGFRLLFGQASLEHVGRGIGSILPVIVAGLTADPLHDQPGTFGLDQKVPLETYLAACERISHLAMEEPEDHLHPKVQTRLAHFLVSLARSGRQLIIETHSDHLVRRLRGLIARAAPGSEAERWLKESVAIIEVEQDEEGVTYLTQSSLTPSGSIAEHWPADFMDTATEEERSIYYAGMDKKTLAEEPPYAADTEFIEGGAAEDE